MKYSKVLVDLEGRWDEEILKAESFQGLFFFAVTFKT